MVTLYLSHNNGILGRSGDSFCYKKQRGGEKELIPSNILDDVVILGHGSVSTPAIHFMMDKNIPLHFIDNSGRYKGSITSGRGRGYHIKKLQYESAAAEYHICQVAREIVFAKIANQLKTLQRAAARRGLNSRALGAACGELRDIASQLCSCTEIDRIRGYEGAAAAVYFSVFGRLLISPWAFTQRNRRPPKDPINAMLSFGYTLLLGHVSTAVTVAGLDPCVGYLHPEYRGRPSLALDLMEEFRAQVVDRLVIALANQMIVRPEDFEPDENGGILMNSETCRNFIRHYSERLDESASSETDGTTSTFRNHIFSQSRAFVRSLRTGEPYRPFIQASW